VVVDIVYLYIDMYVNKQAIGTGFIEVIPMCYEVIKQYTSNTSTNCTSWLHVSIPMGSSSGLLIESRH